MNLSMRWLREFVPLPEMPVRQFTEAMTMSGNKVESWEREGSEISDVVVGKVLSLERHPQSDHLWITETDVGSGNPLQIITGAQNLKVGDLVPVALNGSTLPGGKKIRREKLRGLPSDGMLCSLSELGLSKHDFPYAVEDGIFVLQEDCKIGQPIRDALGFNDLKIEFEITSNRPDCFSVIGLAREAAATFQKPLHLHTPAVKGGAGPCDNLLDVRVEAPDLCPMYSARVIRNVRVRPSPRWIRERLRAMGVRPINNIVDITNYVMLEYGQPMHSFDYRCLSGGKIRVRRAEKGESITTLDGKKHSLTADNLVIADEKKPVAVAGVMGGSNSEITENTSEVVFESACFHGPSIRRTARKIGTRTDASSLYEKGLDPNNCLPALNRACELVELLNAGDVTDGWVGVKNYEEKQRRIPLDSDWINRFLDISVSPERMKEILKKLGCGWDGNDILIPTWRPDLIGKADIAEEIARFYGYDKIPCAPLGGSAQGGYSPRQKLEHGIGETMRALGASEIMTYSFLGPKDYDKIRMPENSPLRRSVTIANPLGEDTSILRTVALPSMMDTLARNYNNRNESACLYELAKIYLPTEPDKLPDERNMLICGMYGENADFLRAKGMVEELLERLGIESWDIRASSEEYSYHPGRCARLSLGGKALGVIGEVHPEVVANYGMEGRVVSFSLDAEILIANARTDRTYTPLPKFPSVTRDLALVCGAEVPVRILEKAIRSGAGNLLEKIRLFDIYRGEQIAGGKKSVAFRIVLRSATGTLTDEKVSKVMKKVMESLERVGAVLRE